MAMSEKEVSYSLSLSELVPEFSKLPSESKDRIKELVADELIGEIQVYLDAAKSPVSGAPYKTFRKDKKLRKTWQNTAVQAASGPWG